MLSLVRQLETMDLTVYCIFPQWPRFHVCFILPSSLSQMLYPYIPWTKMFFSKFKFVTSASITLITHKPRKNNHMKTKPLGKMQ